MDMLEELHRKELELLKDVVALLEKHGLRYTLYCGTLLGAVRHHGFIPWDDDIDLAMPLADYKALLRLSDELEPRYSIVHMDNSPYMYLNWIKVHDNQTAFMRKICTQYPGNYGVSLDIYPFIGAFSSRIGQKLQNLLLQTAYSMRLADQYKLAPESKWNWKYRLLRVLSVIPFPVRSAVARLCRKVAIRDPEKHKTMGTVDWAPFRGKYVPEDWKDMTKLRFEDAQFSAPAKYDKILRIMYGDYMTLPPEYMRNVHRRDDTIIDMEHSYREYLDESK